MENKFDLEANLSYITDTALQTFENKNQIDVLNSSLFNESFKFIENSLNLLYEKTRTLQDVMNYAESFIKAEIDNSVADCRTLLNDIEANRDLIEDSAYISYNVKLQSIFDIYSDRDNSSMKGVQYHSKTIGLSNSTIEEIELSSITIENKDTYNMMNTSTDIISSNSYRTFYMYDRAQSKEVSERIILTLPKIKTINKINLTASNCIIDSIEYIYENGKTETVLGYDSNLTKARDVSAIAINISCTNYIISQVKYGDVKEQDFWGKVDEVLNDKANVLDKANYYYYLFGIDNISLQYVEKEEKSCFVSKELKVGTLEDQEYISLDAQYLCDEGNIEFYIIDGTTEIPILPEHETGIIREQLFHKIGTRFTVDTTKPIRVYKDGILIKDSLNAAINDSNGGYTVSYTPLNAIAINSLKNSVITVKAVIRNYDKNYDPYIKSITVKKYGGGSLWKNEEVN